MLCASGLHFSTVTHTRFSYPWINLATTEDFPYPFAFVARQVSSHVDIAWCDLTAQYTNTFSVRYYSALRLIYLDNLLSDTVNSRVCLGVIN